MIDSFLSSDLEFALAHFKLEFQEPFHLGQGDLFRLRRGLRTAARHILGEDGSERFQFLLDPPLPSDPVALRRFQRPAPPFALLPEAGPEGFFDAGDRLEITASFWGRGVQVLGDFARLLQALGKGGLRGGQGLFELAAIEATDGAGNRLPIWREGEGLHSLAPPVNDVGWWLGGVGGPTAASLEFLTPARLLSQGRPLFKIDFRRLFPFVLRRVTSMLYAHCGAEVIGDPGDLLAAAAQIGETENTLLWRDWRTLEGPGQAQDLGGICGSLRLEGEALLSVWSILRLGSLMNVGKGAAYGAGRYRLLVLALR